MSDAATPLERARAEELGLRRRLAALVVARRRAEADAARLGARAGRPGADPRVGEAAAARRRRAESLGAEVESARALVRRAEGAVAEAEARADGGGE